MRFFDGRVFRLLIFPVLFVCSVLWFLIAYRLLALPFLITVIVLYCLRPNRCATSVVVPALLLFVGLTFSPVDITFENYPGPPRLVPLVMGYPTKETAERAMRGECKLGGCIVSGQEPKWVWVW
jgi:hypothetical protein